MRTITVSDDNYSKIFGLLKHEEEDTTAISQTVKAIIEDIRNHGDVALIAYTNKFERNELSLGQLKVSPAQIDEAYANCPPALLKALELSASRIKSYYEKLKPVDISYTDETGVLLGARYVPIEAVGIYVPGGKANYPSSVLMNAIPAKVAGVSRLLMVVPAQNGIVNPAVLAAAKICGVDEIYLIGGAQAIAALTYGTKIVPKVDKIVGPGNVYVTEAKRQVFGTVGIDMMAGPSEILIIADDNNNPDWIAADLLSQAEHDEEARSILITTSQSFAQKVITSVYEILQTMERQDIARKSIEKKGLVIVAHNISEAVHIANIIAPEHLELAVENPDEVLTHIINAGAIFLGRYTPEAVGDYLAGPSHVLPTVTSARFSSGLSVCDFMKRQSIVGCDKKSFDELAAPTVALARAEGLTAHALSILARAGK